MGIGQKRVKTIFLSPVARTGWTDTIFVVLPIQGIICNKFSLDSGILAGKRDRFLIGSLLENSKDNDQYPPKEVPFPMTTVTTVNF